MKEIIVLTLLGIITMLSFLGVFCMFFPLRKYLNDYYKLMSLYIDNKWKEVRNYIIIMCGFSFIFGMLLTILIALIDGGI